MISDTLDFLASAVPYFGEGYYNILTNGFEEKKHHPIKLSHFSPCTPWEEPEDVYDEDTRCLYMTDSINGDIYIHDSASAKRLKCLALVGATLIVHAIGIILDIANRIAKLITFAHFWHSCNGRDYAFTARLCSFGENLLRIVWDPIGYVGMELAALYGLVLPYDGGKLYATFERITFGGPFLAPCFQPEPEYHLGGGDMNTRDSW